MSSSDAQQKPDTIYGPDCFLAKCNREEIRELDKLNVMVCKAISRIYFILSMLAVAIVINALANIIRGF